MANYLINLTVSQFLKLHLYLTTKQPWPDVFVGGGGQTAD